MFSAHLGFACLLKLISITNNISLGTLFLASQWPDFVFGITLTLGQEWGYYDPSLAGKVFPFTPHFPISHSLFGWLLGTGFLTIFQAFWRKKVLLSEIIVLSIGVLSHWLLDALVNRGTVPILPTSKEPSNFVDLCDLSNFNFFMLEMVSLFVPMALLLISGRLNVLASRLSKVTLFILLAIHLVAQYNSCFTTSTDNILTAEMGPVFFTTMSVLGLLCHCVDNNRVYIDSTPSTKKSL
ncbi:4 TM domain-containing transmembrane protein [Acrasis kona]|uniref:4 TM domain-containing transmembrane protein n=1 Tax=Acrasis kona TaxID=1008807 RepID=A0AAW2ZN03_9EUKA